MTFNQDLFERAVQLCLTNGISIIFKDEEPTSRAAVWTRSVTLYKVDSPAKWLDSIHKNLKRLGIKLYEVECNILEKMVENYTQEIASTSE